jgi:hypothetical protein
MHQLPVTGIKIDSSFLSPASTYHSEADWGFRFQGFFPNFLVDELFLLLL